MGKRDFITVTISNENTQVQILKPGMTGDKIIASAHSRYLLEKRMEDIEKCFSLSYRILGWKKALGQEANDAILYTGTRKYTKNGCFERCY